MITLGDKVKVWNLQAKLLLSTLAGPQVEPSIYNQVVKHGQWQQAMQDEYDALIKNMTWNLLPSPAHGKVIGYKWVYKLN